MGPGFAAAAHVRRLSCVDGACAGEDRHEKRGIRRASFRRRARSPDGARTVATIAHTERKQPVRHTPENTRTGRRTTNFLHHEQIAHRRGERSGYLLLFQKTRDELTNWPMRSR
jgi:hypothetical protein